MKSRIRHNSYVIDFLNKELDTNRINSILESEVNVILEDFQFEELKEWEIVFKALYNKVDDILVFKKTRSYKNEKDKEIVIHIPIPLKSVINWGVNDNQLVQTGINKVNLDKYADSLDANYTDYSNRTDYVLASMRKAIKFCFEDGFTINGKKIKLKK